MAKNLGDMIAVRDIFEKWKGEIAESVRIAVLEGLEEDIAEAESKGMFRYDLDYDWQNADSRKADATLEFNSGEKDPVEFLLSQDRDVSHESSGGDGAVTFIPETINGIRIFALEEETGLDHTDVANGKAEWPGCHWVIAACLMLMKKDPSIRKFEFSGTIE